MTNKEVLIQALQAFDGVGEEYVTDYLTCPYVDDSKCLNEQRGVEYGDGDFYENCAECKAKWLLEEFSE